MVRHVVTLWIALLGAASAAAPQNQGPLDFEVASVKPSEISSGQPVASATGVASPGGRWSATNVTVSQLIQHLYDLRPEQIVGMPSWASSALFVIKARAADTSATRAQLTEMAKRLLNDRFNLRFHVEQQAMKVHAMHLTRRDGMIGPGLRPTRCIMPRTADAASEPLTSPEDRKPCGSFTRKVVDGLSQFQHNGMSLRTLLVVHRVEEVLGTRVVDDTGRFDDLFDVTLQYAPDPFIWRLPAEAPRSPTLITAFAEQLGIAFERRDQTLNRFVIESISAPTAD